MLKYIVVLLSEKSVSYCSYNARGDENRLIELDDLRAAIRFGMKENLAIQFVYPRRRLPQEYLDLIDSVNHVNVMPGSMAGTADVGVVESWQSLGCALECESVIVRTSFNDLLANDKTLSDMFDRFLRINIVINDVENVTADDCDRYQHWLDRVAAMVAAKMSDGSKCQLNLLTDRMFISQMRNCNAGDESITLAPDGRFYVCPAFYYASDRSVGAPSVGLSIPNRQLYELKNAPICRVCDAWHCHRCVWLNKRKTSEVNTPGHIQCVMSHHERNASMSILNKIKSRFPDIKYSEIPEIDYLDPFEKLV